VPFVVYGVGSFVKSRIGIGQDQCSEIPAANQQWLPFTIIRIGVSPGMGGAFTPVHPRP